MTYIQLTTIIHNTRLRFHINTVGLNINIPKAKNPSRDLHTLQNICIDIKLNWPPKTWLNQLTLI